ncbi:MAG TPA: CHAD domain-containing protein [Candidatus Eisenbacteria bacterium]
MPAGAIESIRPRAPSARGAPSSAVASGLRRRIEMLEDALLRTRAGDDRRAIHDLRVVSRRLIAFLRAWGALLPRGTVRRVVRDLRVVRRRVGRARDVEAQVELLRERLAALGSADQPALELLRKLERRLERLRRRAAARVRPGRSERLLTLCAKAEQGLRQDLVSYLQAFEIAHGRETSRRGAVVEAIGPALESEDDAALHGLRIAAKKWRYALESLGATAARGAGATLARLRELQGALGALRDRGALEGLISAQLEGHLPLHGTLPWVLRDLRSEREQERARFRPLARALRDALEEPAAGAAPLPRRRDGEAALVSGG